MTRSSDVGMNSDDNVSKSDSATELGQRLALGGSARVSDRKRTRSLLYFPIDTNMANMAASARLIATQRRFDVEFDATEFRASPCTRRGVKSVYFSNN